MSNLAQLIHTALLGADNSQRVNAENSIMQIANDNTPNFFLEASNIVADENNQESLRQAAGTLIKRFCTPNQNGQSLWSNVQDPNIKQQIKNNLLSTLMTTFIIVKRAAANAISMICALELPKNEWPDLILNLVNNLKNQNEEVRKASIITIGYICESLKSTNQQSQIDQANIDNILFGILLAMGKEQPNLDIKLIAVKALDDSLSFLHSHIQKDEYRNYILQALYEVIRAGNEQIIIAGLQCLIDFSRLFYNYILNNIVELLNFLQPYMLNDKDEIAIPATEIFNTIANEDKDRKQGQYNDQNRQFLNVVGQIQQNLTPILLQNLLRQPVDSEDGDLNVQDSSEKCLISVVEVIGDECINVFTTFISNTINHQQWQYRKAASIAFGCMLDGPTKQKIVPMTLSALPKIVSLLQDSSNEVKLSTSHTLNRVAEFHPECIVENSEMITILQNLLTALQMNIKISRNICWCFNFLSDYVSNIDSSQQMQHPFFQQLNNILQSLIQNAFRQDLTQNDLNIIDVSFMAVMGFIQSSKNIQLSQTYLQSCMDLFIQSQSIVQYKKPSVKMGLLSIIQSCLLTLLDQYDDQGKLVNSYINDQLAQQIYNLIDNEFKQNKDVDSDGIYVISALAVAIKQRFVVYLDNFYSYLVHALQKVNDIELMKIAIHGLSDVSANVGPQFAKYLNEIIPALIQCLKTPSFDRDIKLNIYQCLGDITMGCQMQMEQFLPSILEIFDLGFQAVCQLSGTGNQDSMDYADNLKESLISSYMCIVHALSRTNTQDQSYTNCDKILLRHFPTLIQFIQKSCDKNLHPTIEYMRNCLALIADIANFYNKDVINIVKTQFTQQLILDLNQFQNNKDNEQIVKYAYQIIYNLK